MLTIHTTTVSQDRLLLLYAVMKGLTIAVGRVIEKEIRYYAVKKQKPAALLFPSLITGICKVFGVKIIVSDKRIKNEGALTAKTVKRIV